MTPPSARILAPELILLAVMMPLMNGLEILYRSRASGWERVILVSAGMNDHIADPVAPDRRYETLPRWLRRS